MLHGTETWPMTSAALHRLCRNDRAMIRWICGVKPSDDPSMDELHAKLGICDLAILVRERRLRWFGHVMRSNGEINRVRSRPVPGRKGPGRPKKTWEECVKQDLRKYVVYLRPALRIDCRGDHLWKTVDRSLPRLTGAFFRAWLRLRHGAFWGCAPAPLTKLDLIDWLIDWMMAYCQVDPREEIQQSLIKICAFWLMIHLKMWSVQWQPFCLGLNALKSLAATRLGTIVLCDTYMRFLKTKSSVVLKISLYASRYLN